MKNAVSETTKRAVLLFGIWFGTSCVADGVSGQPVSGCGLAFVPPPNVSVSLKGASPDACDSALQLQIDPRPGYLEEENLLLVSAASFQQAVEASGRFKKTRRGYQYVYTPASGEPGDETQLVGRLATQEVNKGGRQLIIGMASVRVMASPFKMWPSDEVRGIAERKYGIATHGLILDCAYGIAGTERAAVTASTCVPRSTMPGGPKASVIRELLGSVRWD